MGKDAALWLLLAIALLSLAFSFLRQAEEHSQEKVEWAAQLLIDHSPMSFAAGGKVDEERLLALTEYEYAKVKKDLGMEREFCIYFEDAEGNVIPITEKRLGIGSAKISINDQPCRWD